MKKQKLLTALEKLPMYIVDDGTKKHPKYVRTVELEKVLKLIEKYATPL